MFNRYKEVLYSVMLGLVLGAVGVFLMGHVAAIYISEEIILWFEANTLAASAIAKALG